jgi:hypothetical protein
MHLKTLGISEHNRDEGWAVDFHKEFKPEFDRYSKAVKMELAARIVRLKEAGPLLGRPSVDTLMGSRHANMKELRFVADGGVWRVAFAFDPRRRAILLVGGDKAGVAKDRFYENLIAVADRRFQQHLDDLTGATGH